jgi:hypothetical protein
MLASPASTKSSLASRLTDHARQRRPQIATVQVRFRAGLAHVDGDAGDGDPGDGDPLPLCRLRYGGSASRWGFAIYRASHDDYQDGILPTGAFARTPEEALDCAPAAATSTTPPPGNPTHHRRINRQDH